MKYLEMNPSTKSSWFFGFSMLKREEKRSKQFNRVDESAIQSIKELEDFERKNNIKFSYRNQILGFVEAQ